MPADSPTIFTPGTDDSDTTGRYVITFRDPDLVSSGISSLRRQAGVSRILEFSSDSESSEQIEALESSGNIVFPKLGVAVVESDNETITNINLLRDDDQSTILAVEPERYFYATSAGFIPYLEGYRDAVNSLLEKAKSLGEGSITEELIASPTYLDDAQSTWGLKATKVVNSRYSGRGIRVAVLDTGFDASHPDFVGRTITRRSFIPNETPDDQNGHGTHCIGTACGNKDVNGRRYGIAYSSQIFAGKVLANSGTGTTSGILAGIEWAINNSCAVISMSLGNTLATPSVAYEQVGLRALQNGSLIIAAAGNHGGNLPPNNTVGQPANSPSILAVAALDNQLRRAPFSAICGPSNGAKVDIAGPGVNVYSSVPVNKGRYAVYSGTSMATPHLSGIAALYAEAYRARGAQLWQLVVSRARNTGAPACHVGAGIAQAP
ncbi:S8 family serine peptidase [bacterium]|nr:S8 family serine peptidase [bacterium]